MGLNPAGQQPGGAPVPSPAPEDHAPMLDAMHTQAKAKYEGLQKADGQMQMVRKELDKLTAKGPAVSQDDVLDGMAELVGRGIDPKSLTQLMAGNPQNGEPPMPQDSLSLASWLSHQDQVFTLQEQQLKPQLDLARHQMGVAAVHSLVHGHVSGAQGGGGPAPVPAPGSAPPPSSNPLPGAP